MLLKYGIQGESYKMKDYSNQPRFYKLEKLPQWARYSLVLILITLFLGIRTAGKLENNPGKAYNAGYREGMLYAYDNVLICGANPEEEGEIISEILNKPVEISDIICYE